MIRFILLQHLSYLFWPETHLNVKIRRNIPGAVIRMFFLRTQLSFQVLYVTDSGQNNRLKRRKPASVIVITAKLRQKINKHLIVCRAVDLIDHQNGLFRQCAAKHTDFLEQLNQLKVLRICLDSFGKCLQRFTAYRF